MLCGIRSGNDEGIADNDGEKEREGFLLSSSDIPLHRGNENKRACLETISTHFGAEQIESMDPTRISLTSFISSEDV